MASGALSLRSCSSQLRASESKVVESKLRSQELPLPLSGDVAEPSMGDPLIEPSME